ncbi:hypothetical protein Q9L42_009200 [Methylomarinum sp. Ch1-1]|uniref:Uncharacterized protein n=1 Tax=Methylomarinum roseum TaxID=3067653 RepID=A0AAU7P0C7_9GAMM|nr:hypothetical protein [Methylomarinum sp. Ch1-1]MDP4521589.1 hypothetical protein [Methylomarinum sp. Ch1-1]
MNINPATSALNLISHSQQKANEAAHTIATLPVQKEEVGGADDFASDELFKPVLSLKEAEQESQAAVKLLQTDQKMQQSLIDEFV